MKNIILIANIIIFTLFSTLSYAIDIKKTFEKPKTQVVEKKENTKAKVRTKKKIKKKLVNIESSPQLEKNAAHENTSPPVNDPSLENANPEPTEQQLPPQRKCFKLWGKTCFFGD